MSSKAEAPANSERTAMTHVTIERAKFEQVLEALEEIALAGMSGTGQESEEAMTAWHARQAWKFIGIAARALEPIKQARSAPTVQEPAKRVCSLGCKNLGACCAVPKCEAVAAIPPAQPAPVTTREIDP
jgi:hypothetical protein